MYEQIKAVLFDLDGTIYYGSQMIEKADQVVQKFRDIGKHVYCMTNNSTKSRQQVCEKLLGMGLVFRKDQIYTSGYAAALYAKEKGYKSVYVSGTEALKREFAEMGIQTSGIADVVVIGYDMEFNYQKLTKALQAALQAKVIIACNKETHYPGEGAKRMPGCGAMVGALEGSLGKQVDYVVGKPNPLLLDIICKQQKLQKKEILVVGDTYESDIKMAEEYGCQAIFIGETKEVLSSTRKVAHIKEILEWI
ncbi:MAG: HAD-IIA family hydrolase [Lachnospiraceae bacterium]|jgi:HAD superfamily hydrolase (TIGR01450 family)|nr:HAD-IIA family hydrolase [Lachnospiraceae bacterium]